ncbi:hypothetical protein [Rubinisphaera margarita]|uniref:hypothetical protein n=1 Tax=Rubinisphaera margarita TaxID=2909586 RepID=UPI001EE85D9E|nr:hypothetical protein [Rubinisphaera margarita]MCG6157527.1 hypothetical protein [Rubinisphaera margarita]
MTSATTEATTVGTLVSWQNGIGDDKKYHIAYVSPVGVTLVRKMKDHSQWENLVAAAESSPGDAAVLLRESPQATHYAPGDISKATYSKDLWQLSLFDRDGKKIKVPEGKEQEQIFAAMKTHLGGVESEEEADAWSVIQGPLFIVSVIAVIGGFFIWFTAICEPNYEASGRRSGMKQLMNTIGYQIGPVWMSIIVGTLAAITLGGMTYQLIKRPIRQVLQYPA